MVGELYQKLGLLSHGRVNHYSRRDLVREGTAAEEQLVRQALKNSIGGFCLSIRPEIYFIPKIRTIGG